MRSLRVVIILWLLLVRTGCAKTKQVQAVRGKFYFLSSWDGSVGRRAGHGAWTSAAKSGGPRDQGSWRLPLSSAWEKPRARGEAGLGPAPLLQRDSGALAAWPRDDGGLRQGPAPCGWCLWASAGNDRLYGVPKGHRGPSRLRVRVRPDQPPTENRAHPIGPSPRAILEKEKQ